MNANIIILTHINIIVDLLTHINTHMIFIPYD